MKQVVRRVIDRKGKIRVEEVPSPRCGTNDVLIDVRFSVISSGTEMSTLNKTFPELVKQTLKDPWMRQAVKNILASGGVAGTLDRVHDELIAHRLVGYSGAGLALETGSGVKDVSAGDLVAYSGQGHAEVVRASRNQAVRVPAGLSLEEAAFGTVGSIALQGVRRAGIELGHRVAMIGLGLMGQVAFQLAQACGARCVGVEPVALRRDLALANGISWTVDPTSEDSVARVLELTGGVGADRVLICASGKDKSIANDALKMCRAQGRVTVLGIVPMDLERMPFFRKELDFVFSRAYGPGPMDQDWESGRIEYPSQYVRWDARRNMGAFLDQVASGRVKIKPLISATYPMESAQDAYDAVCGGQSMASLLSCEPVSEEKPAVHRVPVKARARPPRSETARVAFIGCGNFTRSVLLPELKKVKGASIRAIAASSGINAKPMAEKYGAAYITTKIDEVLDDEEVDAVVISTRHHLHAPIALQALKAGKHVMVEKPMAVTPADAVRIEGLAREKGLHLIVGHNRRYAPLTRRLLASRPTSGGAMMQYTVSIRPLPAGHWTINEEEGGGRLLGESDHFFDILNLFAGSPPRSVSAAALLAGEQKLFESCDFSVQIQYENGSVGQLLYTDLGHARFPRERLEVFCGGAVLRLEDYGRAEALSTRGWKSKGKVRMGHDEELANFVGVILGKEKPSGTAADGLAATLVAQGAYRSLQTGGTVRIADLSDAERGQTDDVTDAERVDTQEETALLGELFDATSGWDLLPDDEDASRSSKN
jgi:predicted dehydrogenase/threonine dehydrogenase-like Zn-dependent dehydrogenase